MDRSAAEASTTLTGESARTTRANAEQNGSLWKILSIGKIYTIGLNSLHLNGK
jgi:hypothetical protein